MKRDVICGFLGVLGGTIAKFFGGWTLDLQTLVLFMVVDFITGLMVAGIFKKSTKTATGALQSNIGWLGLCRKGMTLFIVLIAHRLDMTLGFDYIRTVVIIGFIVNESISIIENAGLMGVNIPTVLVKAIDVLKQKESEVK